MEDATLPVILFVPKLELQDVARALHGGVDALLPMPCAPDRIAAQVRQTLDTVQAKPQSPVRLLFGETRLDAALPPARTCNLLLSCICHDKSDLASAAEETAAAQAHTACKTGLAILLAEDNPTSQMYLSRLLESMGHAFTLAANGKEALELAQRESFDVALLDIQMPVMDGIETLQKLRASEEPRIAGMPAVAITAHGLTGDRERLLQQGFDEYISKPISPEDLAAALDTVLRDAAQAAAGSSREAVPPAEPGKVLDTSKTLRRLKDPQFVTRLYAMFLEDLERRTQGLHTAKDENDLSRLCKLAHSLKGAAATIDAGEVLQRAYETECVARSRDSAGCGECLERLDHALDTLRCKLEQHVAQKPEELR